MRFRPLIYALLLAGAVVFSFPFAWMLSTSLKTDRELFKGQVDLLPQQPDPRAKSPYYDSEYFADVEVDSPRARRAAPILAEKVRIAFPQDEQIPKIVTAGLLKRLIQRTPPSLWEADDNTLRNYLEQDTTADQITAVANEAYRELGIGAIHVRSKDLKQVELAAGVSPSQRWKVEQPNVANFTDRTDGTLPYAAVRYDFDASKDSRFTIHQTFALPFDAAQLQRIILRVRPDDTWHAYTLSAEWNGVRYVAERKEPLAENRWLTMWYQLPSADDYSTKIKKWRVLEAAERGPQFDHGARRLRVSIEFVRATRTSASFAKAERNYWRVRDFIPFWRYVRVSVLLVLLNVVLTVLSSSLVAYSFARLRWPGRDAMFLVLLGTMMIPGQVTMIPHFLIWKWVGAYNTLTPLWAGAALGNAFFIFLMRQFLKGIPPDLEDAARIDGCGFLRTWWHVMLPLVKPSLAAIAIFTFMATWNDFLTPLIYIADGRLYPLAFGLYAFAVQVDNNPVLTMGASLLMTIPVIVVFFAAQRYFIQGVTLTGLKG